jgi:hypothetical protein
MPHETDWRSRRRRGEGVGKNHGGGSSSRRFKRCEVRRKASTSRSSAISLSRAGSIPARRNMGRGLTTNCGRARRFMPHALLTFSYLFSPENAPFCSLVEFPCPPVPVPSNVRCRGFGGERGIRTPGRVLPLQRFSKPPLSTTQPSLHNQGALTRGGEQYACWEKHQPC